MKYSRQRELVREAVLHADCHPTADEVYHKVRQKEPNVSLATVYRNLHQLVEHGIIRRIVIPGDPDRFDHRMSDHEHMICTVCGRVEDVFFDQPPLRLLAEASDVPLTSYDLVLYGLCRHCRNLDS